VNFTLKQLRYIEATGRLGAIAKAANELNISQSSITAAIGALESQIGFDLFVRTPAKGIQITPAGHETLKLIRSFITQSHHFEAEMIAIGGNATGSVRISCYATAAPSFLPPILKNFKTNYPNTSIKLLEGNMEATMGYLNNGEADVAFTYEEMLEDRQDFTPLFSAPPYALMAADDPLAQGTSVSLVDLAERPMIMLDLPRTNAYFTSMFSALGLKPNLAHSTRSVEIVRALVSSGHGYSILNIFPPNYNVDDTRFRALPIRDEVNAPVFGIVTLAGTTQPSIVKAFIEQCVDLKKAGVFDQIVVKGNHPFPH
jgi:DNA-binding transcriptional LysR family regulator